MAAALLAFVATRSFSVHAQTAAKTSLVIAAVADAQSGAPVADAEVRLSDVNLSARTDWSGEVRIPNVGAKPAQVRDPALGLSATGRRPLG
jgi:hypothetical protein